MRRVLSVWFPTLSSDLVKRRLTREGRGEHLGTPMGTPTLRVGSVQSAPFVVLLTRTIASRELVERRCERAINLGVREGMDLAQARSLLPSHLRLHHEEHRSDRDAEALHALACWALRVSPIVAPDPPDGLLIDITGTPALRRGEAWTIRTLAARLRARGFESRIAAASTFGTAWALARHGDHGLSRVAPDREREALEDLPIAALRVGEATQQGFREIGIRSVGEVMRLPRASLAARFDAELLHRLQQALGEIGEAIEPVRPPPPIVSELKFDGPTDHWESVEAAVRRVLEQLVTQLTSRERGVRRLDLDLIRPRAAPTRVKITLSRPSRSGKHLWSLVRNRLERVDLSEGCEGVVLHATKTARLRHAQLGSFELGANPGDVSGHAWGEMVDTLVGRLGADQVVRLEPVESHLPERAIRVRSVLEEEPRARTNGSARATNADRPTTLFARPEPADAMALTPDGPLLSLGWRGRRWNVITCRGPERLGPEWWRWGCEGDITKHGAGLGRRGEEKGQHKERVKGEMREDMPAPAARERRRARGRAPPPPDRDYFAVQTEEGRWLWVCRQCETGAWFVHGEWS